MIKKGVKRLELAHKKVDKLTFIKLNFSMNDYKSLAEKEIFNLSSSAQDFFHIIYGFDQNEIITNCVNVWILKDTIQMDTTITCGPFQLYFYENLFFLDEHSKLQNYKKLTNIALETLLKRFFTLNREKNEQILIEYKDR